MADSKISALPASTTPLAGTEVLPIVQSSTTKQVSVANLTAGRTFDALGMTLTSTDAGATAAPLLDLYRDSASPAASDTLGEIEFNGEDSAGNKQQYALIHASILSPTSTAEQGQLHFETATAGASTEKMIIGTSNLVINEIGAVFNVRIEGDTDANLFFTDATNSRIGIGTISPSTKLDIVGGDARIDNGNLVLGTSAKGLIDSTGVNTLTLTSTQTTVNKILSAVNFRTLFGAGSVPGLGTATVLTLSSSVQGVYIVQANFGAQGSDIYTGVLIVAANAGSFRIVTNGSGTNSVMTLSGANVQLTNAIGSALDFAASAILIAG